MDHLIPSRCRPLKYSTVQPASSFTKESLTSLKLRSRADAARYDVTQCFAVENQFVLNTGVMQQIAKPNPARIAILFSAFGGTACYVSTKQQLSGTQGIVVNPTTNPVTFDYENDPLFCQLGWFGGAGGAAGFTVIEIIALR